MATQDRNVHRDAEIARRSLALVARVPAAGVDQDEPIYASQPRYNYRVVDLQAYADVLATAGLELKAQTVPELAVAGSPQAAAAAAVSFGIEEFWQNDGAVLTNVAAIAAQAFSAAFTVLDGFWGVVLVMIDGGQTVTTQAQAPTMGFLTEALALANAPRVPSGQGRVLILTIEAVGADFDATADNTDTANQFNTAPQDGHVVTLPIAAVPQQVNAVLGGKAKDASGTNILDGKGGVGGDLLVVTSRSDGAAVITNGTAVVTYRPWPIAGEGVGDASVSQTSSQFVP